MRFHLGLVFVVSSFLAYAECPNGDNQRAFESAPITFGGAFVKSGVAGTDTWPAGQQVTYTARLTVRNVTSDRAQPIQPTLIISRPLFRDYSTTAAVNRDAGSQMVVFALDADNPTAAMGVNGTWDAAKKEWQLAFPSVNVAPLSSASFVARVAFNGPVGPIATYPFLMLSGSANYRVSVCSARGAVTADFNIFGRNSFNALDAGEISHLSMMHVILNAGRPF